MRIRIRQTKQIGQLFEHCSSYTWCRPIAGTIEGRQSPEWMQGYQEDPFAWAAQDGLFWVLVMWNPWRRVRSPGQWGRQKGDLSKSTISKWHDQLRVPPAYGKISWHSMWSKQWDLQWSCDCRNSTSATDDPKIEGTSVKGHTVGEDE